MKKIILIVSLATSVGLFLALFLWKWQDSRTNPAAVLNEAFDRYWKKDWGRLEEKERKEIISQLSNEMIVFDVVDIVDGITMLLKDGRKLRLAYLEMAPEPGENPKTALTNLVIKTGGIVAANKSKIISQTKDQVVADAYLLMGKEGISFVGIAQELLQIGVAVLNPAEIRKAPAHYRIAAEIAIVEKYKTSIRAPFSPCDETKENMTLRIKKPLSFRITKLGMMEVLFILENCEVIDEETWLEKAQLIISDKGQLIDRYQSTDLKRVSSHCEFAMPSSAFSAVHSLENAKDYDGKTFELIVCKDNQKILSYKGVLNSLMGLIE